jgi:hypothetical protein
MTTTKITATATASNGKKFQRTTNRARFNFALIVIDGNRAHAHFFETKQEAAEKQEAITKNFVHTAGYDANVGCTYNFEIVPVVNA